MVVCSGATPQYPDAATEPILDIETLVAFVVVQLRVELLPATTLVGVAESVQVGAFGTVTTVTVVVQVTVPPEPVAVRVYVVVCDGETTREPLRPTAPTLVRLTLVAFVVFHESVDAPPWVIEVGLAESTQVGDGGGFTTTVVVQVTVPPAPVATNV